MVQAQKVGVEMNEKEKQAEQKYNEAKEKAAQALVEMEQARKEYLETWKPDSK